MTATSMSRLVLPGLALCALCAVSVAALVFGLQRVGRDVPPQPKVAFVAPAATKPAMGAAEDKPAPLAKALAEANAVVAALGPAQTDAGDGVPAFDVASIEPSGDAVVAGRAAPGATVELLRNGEPHDRAVADRSGQFAMVPSRLPPGSYDLTLRVTQPDGKQITSRQSVAVVIEPGQQERPVAALMTPGKPTVVLSQPATSVPAGGPVAVETVETEAGGKLHVSGRARAGATVRLYLNDSYLASVTAAADGRFAVTISKGVAPGDYRVRLDEVEGSAATVRSRAEVPFNVPDAVLATGSVPQQAAASVEKTAVASGQRFATAAATTPSGGELPSAVVVPGIITTTVSRGDSLWRISRVTYGAGTRYAVIYNANRQQIRNPDRIYPGQIFVLPAKER